MTAIKSADRFTDPDCFDLLRDLREMERRAEILKQRLDRGGVVGHFSGVCAALRTALDSAECTLSRDE